ncbi:MAG: hypothetical protein OSJ56_10595 [Prevotella sp.]|nr:hypothetical protein [Prevotella sp.]
MAKHFIKANPDKQLDKRLRAALGSILYTQAAVKAALDQAEGFMTEAELANSRSYCHLCQYDAQCEDIFQTLCGELGNRNDNTKQI